jgi:hypothetical protein
VERVTTILLTTQVTKIKYAGWRPKVFYSSITNSPINCWHNFQKIGRICFKHFVCCQFNRNVLDVTFNKWLFSQTFIITYKFVIVLEIQTSISQLTLITFIRLITDFLLMSLNNLSTSCVRSYRYCSHIWLFLLLLTSKHAFSIVALNATL